MLTDRQDAYGHALYDHLLEKGGFEIVERDDGMFNLSAGPALYFRAYEDWPVSEQKAMEYVEGKVLDIGCGAGRHALYLQGLGHAVTGIDNSPLAIKVCQERGLQRALVLPATQVSSIIGIFDTIIMMGNNFGLVSNPKRARWLLRKFHRMTSESGQIIAQTRDPYQTDDPDHLAYHESNRKRGRMAGQLRIRIRYKKYVSTWFDYLMVSKSEMQEILAGTGWGLVEWIEDPDGVSSAVIKKT
jgi:SAM-dependent methyltransferase